MVKEFYLRGKTYEEFRAMPMEEILKMLPARQRRSLTRGLTSVQKKLLERVKKQQGKGDKMVRTKSRDMIILPEMVGVKLGIYDGKEFKSVMVTQEMVGRYIGEFSQTRRKVQHGSPGFGATRASKFIPLK